MLLSRRAAGEAPLRIVVELSRAEFEAFDRAPGRVPPADYLKIAPGAPRSFSTPASGCESRANGPSGSRSRRRRAGSGDRRVRPLCCQPACGPRVFLLTAVVAGEESSDRWRRAAAVVAAAAVMRPAPPRAWSWGTRVTAARAAVRHCRRRRLAHGARGSERRCPARQRVCGRAARRRPRRPGNAVAEGRRCRGRPTRCRRAAPSLPRRDCPGAGRRAERLVRTPDRRSGRRPCHVEVTAGSGLVRSRVGRATRVAGEPEGCRRCAGRNKCDGSHGGRRAKTDETPAACGNSRTRRRSGHEYEHLAQRLGELRAGRVTASRRFASAVAKTRSTSGCSPATSGGLSSRCARLRRSRERPAYGVAPVSVS